MKYVLDLGIYVTSERWLRQWSLPGSLLCHDYSGVWQFSTIGTAHPSGWGTLSVVVNVGDFNWLCYKQF